MKPINGSVVGPKRKAGAIETNKAKKIKLTGDLNTSTSSEGSIHGTQEYDQRQPAPPGTVAAGTQSSKETESSSTSEVSDSSVSVYTPQIPV